MTTTKTMNRFSARAASLALVVLLFGCSLQDTLLQVDNPNVIDAREIDPERDASLLAGSAVQAEWSASGMSARHDVSQWNAVAEKLRSMDSGAKQLS